MDDKPNAGPASIYLLERFIELNDAHQEALDNLKPGLWFRLIAAVNGKMNPFDVEDELLTTLNKQKKYVKPFIILSLFLIISPTFRLSVLYSFDEHQLLFPIDGRDPARAPINLLPDYFGHFASWQAGTAGVSYSYLLLLPLFTLLIFLSSYARPQFTQGQHTANSN